MDLKCHDPRVVVAGLFVGLAVLLSPAVPRMGAQTPAHAPAATSVRVLVAYLSQSGHTETMAIAVANGARSVPGATVVLKKIADVTDADLLGADAIVVGTPVYNGGVAAEVKRFIERWPFGRLKDKVGAAFSTGSGLSAGQESALLDLVRSMLIFQFVIVGGDSWQSAFGASAVTEEGKPKDQQGVDEAAKAKARGLGARAARVAQALEAPQAQPAPSCSNATGRALDIDNPVFALVVPAAGAPAYYPQQSQRGALGDCDPAAGACRLSHTLSEGLPIQVMFEKNGWTCATIEDSQGRGSDWVRSDQLRILETRHPLPEDWAGTWTTMSGDARDRIVIAPEGTSGTLAIKGTVYGWLFAGPDDRHPREQMASIEAHATPEGAKLEAAELTCTVRMQLIGPYLRTIDNARCGGMNARFLGLWKPVKPAR